MLQENESPHHYLVNYQFRWKIWIETAHDCNFNKVSKGNYKCITVQNWKHATVVSCKPKLLSTLRTPNLRLKKRIKGEEESRNCRTADSGSSNPNNATESQKQSFQHDEWELATTRWASAGIANYEWWQSWHSSQTPGSGNRIYNFKKGRR